MSDIETLTEDEIQSLGMSSVVHAGEIDPDNAAANALANGTIPMQDKDGRQIISYKQYIEFGKLGVRLDNYAMRMFWPGTNKANTIQASKFLKWYGLGYRPVGGAEENKRRAKVIEEFEMPADMPVFFCNKKYADCKRFFDSERGLKFHWQKDHGETQTTKQRMAEPKE